jgi:hypothetical protein
VKLTAQVKLLPTLQEAAALAATLQVANETANWLSAEAFIRNVTSRHGLQRLAYLQVKARGLSAQPALHVIRKVATPMPPSPRTSKRATWVRRAPSGTARRPTSRSGSAPTPPSRMTTAAFLAA